MAIDETYLRSLVQQAVSEASAANHWTLVDDLTGFVAKVYGQVELWSLLAQTPPSHVVERAVQYIYCQHWYAACLVPNSQRHSQAWAELRAYLARLVVRLNHELLYDGSAADDMVQIISVQIWKDLAQVREPGSFLGWVNQVARRLMFKRPKEPLTLPLEDFDERRPLPGPTTFTPTGNALATLTFDAARTHAEALICQCLDSDLAQAVAIGRFLDEREVKDLAEELGLAPGHVRVLAHRARKQLEKCAALLALQQQHNLRSALVTSKTKTATTPPRALRVAPDTLVFEHICRGQLPNFLFAQPTAAETTYQAQLQQHFAHCKACETEFNALNLLAQKLARLRLAPAAPPVAQVSLAVHLQRLTERFTTHLPTAWAESCTALLEIFLEHIDEHQPYPNPVPNVIVGWRAEVWRLLASLYTTTQIIFKYFRNTPNYAAAPPAVWRAKFQEAAAQAVALQTTYAPNQAALFVQHYLNSVEPEREYLLKLFNFLNATDYSFT